MSGIPGDTSAQSPYLIPVGKIAGTVVIERSIVDTVLSVRDPQREIGVLIEIEVRQVHQFANEMSEIGLLGPLQPVKAFPKNPLELHQRPQADPHLHSPIQSLSTLLEPP
jgi:hypothetical protein